MSTKTIIKGFGKLSNEELERYVIQALGLTAQIVISEARRLTPVDTGRLRNGWLQRAFTKNTVIVGNRVEYAPYLEFGTRYITGKHMLEQAIHIVKKRNILVKILKKVLKNANR